MSNKSAFRPHWETLGHLKRTLCCNFQDLGISASTVVHTPVLGCSNVNFWACSATATAPSGFKGSRLPYMRSPTIGHPREASWTRSWCRRPVLGCSSTSETSPARFVTRATVSADRLSGSSVAFLWISPSPSRPSITARRRASSQRTRSVHVTHTPRAAGNLFSTIAIYFFWTVRSRNCFAKQAAAGLFFQK